MDLHRIHLKFFIEDADALSKDATFKIFNRWISEADGEVLVDVADYSHVPDGPVTLLAGHEANYSIDNHGGRLGLLYGRKQPLTGDLDERLQTACRAALTACRRLEEDPLLEGRLRFAGGELLLVANDRLNAPNDEATRQTLQPAFEKLLAKLYDGAAAEIGHDEDPKRLFSLHARAQTDAGVGDLLARIES